MSGKQKKDDCPEERRTHGKSPFGIVKDEEILARFILLSDEYSVDSRNCCIRKGALPTQDIREQDGWSLVRRDHVGDMAVALEKYASKKGRRGEEYGYALVKTADVRKFLDEEQQRTICVIDDPQKGCPVHALAQKGCCTDMALRRIRKILLDEFKKFGKVKKLDKALNP